MMKSDPLQGILFKTKSEPTLLQARAVKRASVHHLPTNKPMDFFHRLQTLKTAGKSSAQRISRRTKLHVK